MGLGLAVQQRVTGSHARAPRATRMTPTTSARMAPTHRLQRTFGNAATARALRSHGVVQRQPETCPSTRHDQANRAGTCPTVRRERGERRRFDALGASVRTVVPNECYVLENFSIASTNFGILRELDEIADILLLDPGTTLHLTGFTDCLGGRDANANLRALRAAAVEDYFITVLLVDRSRVFVESARDTEYLTTNDTAMGRAGNRAVAIYVERGPAQPSQPPPQPEQPPQPPQPPRDPATLSDMECALQVAQGLGTAWLAALPNCPCTTADVATENATLADNPWSESNTGIGCFHPGSARCFRRDAAGHAQQCCYDAAGALITSGAAAGTPDFVPSSGTGHQSIDVWTWTILGWERYDEFWVPNNGNRCRDNPVTAASSCSWYHTIAASRPATCAPPAAPTPTP